MLSEKRHVLLLVPLVLERANPLPKPLPQSRAQQCLLGANHFQWPKGSLIGFWGLPADQLVVSSINNDQIRLVSCRFHRDASDHVGIDTSHGRVDHLKGLIRVTMVQQPFQNTAKTESRLGRTHRSRFSQNENT